MFSCFTVLPMLLFIISAKRISVLQQKSYFAFNFRRLSRRFQKKNNQATQGFPFLQNQQTAHQLSPVQPILFDQNIVKLVNSFVIERSKNLRFLLYLGNIDTVLWHIKTLINSKIFFFQNRLWRALVLWPTF